MEKKKSLYTVEELAGAHEENIGRSEKNSKSLWKNTSKTKKGQVIKWQEFLQTELQKSVRELILM